MYRPFMTCDDPKGVVECGAIRKYRTSSQKMKEKTKNRRPAETSLANKQDKEEKVSKGSTERSFDPSSLQLMEVSRGAQRLNNMIHSWSRGLRYDERSEDIAKDLLKGALDLQESLLMLRKVQEASQHMASLKRRQNEKSERGRFDAKVIDGTAHCDHFGEQSYPMRFQRRWPSADGSSSSCNEELKKVIKESLVRQNLFTTTEGLDSASTFRSTNSSQSSVAWNDRLSDSSFSPTTSRRERGSNLVAKLMGLEEASSRSFPAVIQKQLESPMILNQKRPVFDIDMPKVRKNVETVNLEHKMTLKEVLETTHFNGVLKSPVREPKVQVHHSIDPHYKHFGDLPPIVLMKPRCTPYRECAKSYEHVVPPEELSLRNLKAKFLPSKVFQHREGSTTNMGKKMEEYVSKRLAKEERANLLREGVELKEKEIKPVENEKEVSKPQSHVSQKSQVNETVDKKAKVKTITSRKLSEKEVSKPKQQQQQQSLIPLGEVPKPKVVKKSQDKGEISSTSTKLRKPQSGSRIDKNEIPSRKSTASNSNTISKPKSKKNSNTNSKEQKKNQMKKQRPTVAEPEAAKPVDEQLRAEEANSLDVSCKDDCPEIRIITTTYDLSVEHEEVDAYANKIREICELSQSSSSDDILMLKSEHENDAIPAEEAHSITNISFSETDREPDKDSSELKYLLLTSQSFIEHAEELLNLDVDCPKILPRSETKEIANLKLYLDCANELTERKSLQGTQAVHPFLLTCAGHSRYHISLGRLVDEVYSAIEHLTSYSEKLASDNIYAMMERDIKSNNGLINGIWNWGWRHGFSADEAEQVVNEVENLVLGELIEEVIVNL
ncbi:hypothetical protein AAZX31_09G174700 [Glycine max]|nr:hypothetical protein JHK85_026214 [Glycine max]KAG5013462.1 hypothetical protein JHK86_025723 [Glycine max]KAH1043742.1 hypothetical protein GYH30_025539 [Glycine max]KAH1043743.1 hypothetical protein GYH30_025539 [Glycine max]